MQQSTSIKNDKEDCSIGSILSKINTSVENYNKSSIVNTCDVDEIKIDRLDKIFEAYMRNYYDRM